MTLGTLVVTAILVVIVAAIIISMVRSHRAGKHVGCDGCGACGHNHDESSHWCRLRVCECGRND